MLYNSTATAARSAPGTYTLFEERASEWQKAHLLHQSVSALVILASGFCSLAATCLKALCTSTSKVPVAIIDGYILPAWIDATVLVVAISPAGLSQELIYSLSEAADRHAPVWVITGSDGHLYDIAVAQGYPWMPMYCDTHHPIGEFVAAFWTLYGALGGLLGLPNENNAPKRTMFNALSLQSGYLSGDVNDAECPARLMSVALGESDIRIYASPGLMAATASVWKSIINVCGRLHADAYAFPSVEYDELISWDQASVYSKHPGQRHKSVLFVRDAHDDPKVRERVENVRGRLASLDGSLNQHEIVAYGESDLERMWSALQFGFWVAAYLADVSGFS